MNRPSARARRRSPNAARFHGFTLLELLVAIAILAVVAVIAWQGLSTLLATRARLDPEVDDARAVVATFGQMQEDLAHVPVNAALFELPAQPVRVLSVDGQPALEIVRLAPSPDGSGASALQPLIYRVHDGRLERDSGPVQRNMAVTVAVDAGNWTSVDLLPGVDAMAVRAWKANAGWVAPVDAATAAAPGIEVQLRRHDGGVLRRVFLVGAQ
ncbi:general secretion pathway protein J [Burkholderiales bacterium GJ-E10]|nr:general secretion pathway protein J [Burkholderiales bacterium GJ-E10]